MAKKIEAKTQAAGKPPEWKYFEIIGIFTLFQTTEKALAVALHHKELLPNADR